MNKHLHLPKLGSATLSRKGSRFLFLKTSLLFDANKEGKYLKLDPVFD